MRRPHLRFFARLAAGSLAALLLAAPVAGCDGDEGAATTPDATVGDTATEPDDGQADVATPDEDTATPSEDVTGGDVEAADDAAASPDEGPAAVTYPEGPYGTREDERIADLGFWDPWEGRTVHLSEFYARPEVKMIVLISGAGWCGPCQMEAEDMVEYYDLYQKDGLEIVYTLFDGHQPGKFLYTGAAGNETYSDSIMNQWKDLFSVDYPLFGDPGHQLEPYFYPEVATPLTVVVRTRAKKKCPPGFDHPACRDMIIEKVDLGYGKGLIYDSILSILYN